MQVRKSQEPGFFFLHIINTKHNYSTHTDAGYIHKHNTMQISYTYIHIGNWYYDIYNYSIVPSTFTGEIR